MSYLLLCRLLKVRRHPLTNFVLLPVAERLKQDAKQDSRSTETMEELEDSEGNVYDKRTYEDLKRQGLLS